MRAELGLIVICAITMYYYWFFYMDYKAYFTAPKKIWTYLPPSKDTNPSVERARRLCITEWKRHHPDMEIVVLTDENWQGYVRIPQELYDHPIFKETVERRMRLLQFAALIEHGGIWMDPSVWTSNDIRTWIIPKHTSMVAFYAHAVHVEVVRLDKKNKPIAEVELRPSLLPSMIVAKKAHPFLIAWQKEWLKLMEYACAEDYVEARRSWKVPMEHLADPIGNTTEVALQTMYQFYPPSRDAVIFRPQNEATEQGLQWLTEKEIKERVSM
jgi:hypothetical protein